MCPSHLDKGMFSQVARRCPAFWLVRVNWTLHNITETPKWPSASLNEPFQVLDLEAAQCAIHHAIIVAAPGTAPAGRKQGKADRQWVVASESPRRRFARGRHGDDTPPRQFRCQRAQNYTLARHVLSRNSSRAGPILSPMDIFGSERVKFAARSRSAISAFATSNASVNDQVLRSALSKYALPK